MHAIYLLSNLTRLQGDGSYYIGAKPQSWYIIIGVLYSSAKCIYYHIMQCALYISAEQHIYTFWNAVMC